MSSRNRFKIERSTFSRGGGTSYIVDNDETDELLEEIKIINEKLASVQTKIGMTSLDDTYIENYIAGLENHDNTTFNLYWMFEFLKSKLGMIENVVDKFILVDNTDNSNNNEILIKCDLRLQGGKLIVE